MDPQKSAANRVRHILQAMERSIDSARSRRVGHPASRDPMATPTSQRMRNGYDSPRMNATAPSPAAPQSVAPPAPGQLMIGAPAPTAPGQAPVTKPGVPHLNGEGQPQPQRLKAKPKRFDGGLNSAFAPPPAYRSQAG